MESNSLKYFSFTQQAAPSNASNSTSIEDDNATKTEIKKCTRISNGQEDRETRFHVDIDSFNDCFGERRQGAGSLISDKHVLTAANVIEGWVMRILLLPAQAEK